MIIQKPQTHREKERERDWRNCFSLLTPNETEEKRIEKKNRVEMGKNRERQRERERKWRDLWIRGEYYSVYIQGEKKYIFFLTFGQTILYKNTYKKKNTKSLNLFQSFSGHRKTQ